MFITIVGIDVEVRSESWVAGANGFWLLVQVDSWLWVGDASSFGGLGCRSSGFWLCFLGFNGFCGGLLMTVAMVVVLFSVFCFAMDCGYHGGGGGGGGSGNVVVVIIILYYVVYIILMYSKYYFNVYN